MTYEAFTVDRDDRLATVQLTGPGKGNAMGPAFWKECSQIFDALDQDDDVRAIIVRGSGKTFSYGLDLMAMAGELSPMLGNPGAPERTQLLDVIRQMQDALDSVARCRKPVIAAVHGYCIGGGLDLAAACDLRICSEDARFSLREAKVGMVADVGSLQRLPHIIGESATRELAFTGKDITAQRALSLGLVSDVTMDEETLWAHVTALADDIANNPPLVVQGVKQIMNARIQDEIQTGLRQVATWNAAFLPSEDLMEAMAAFAERREPKFKGR